MSLTHAPKHIPDSARPSFQEYNVDLLDVDQNAALIIERILAYESRAEVRWLLDTYGRDQVRDWIDCHRESSGGWFSRPKVWRSSPYPAAKAASTYGKPGLRRVVSLPG